MTASVWNPNPVTIQPQASTVNNTYNAGFRNKIINGKFDIWQRGTSAASSSASSKYVADRWNNECAGSASAVQQLATTPGTFSSIVEPSFVHRVIVTSVAGAANFSLLSQSIEDVRVLAGQTCTLSFWARADAPKNIAVELLQLFGAGGSTQVSTPGGLIALTTNFQYYTVTFTIPAITGKTIGDASNCLKLYFWFDAGSSWNTRASNLGQQSGAFDIACVQLEQGSVATPFENRPIAVELPLCQRYYQQFLSGGSAKGNVTTASVLGRMTIPLPVQMRIAPVLAITSALSYTDSSNTGTVTTLGTTYITQSIIEFDAPVATGTPVVGRPAMFYQNGSGMLTANAEY